MTVQEAHDARAKALSEVVKMVNRDGRPDVSKVGMLKTIQKLERASRDLGLAEARAALEKLA